jgi:hypothetical protein
MGGRAVLIASGILGLIVLGLWFGYVRFDGVECAECGAVAFERQIRIGPDLFDCGWSVPVSTKQILSWSDLEPRLAAPRAPFPERCRRRAHVWVPSGYEAADAIGIGHDWQLYSWREWQDDVLLVRFYAFEDSFHRFVDQETGGGEGALEVLRPGAERLRDREEYVAWHEKASALLARFKVEVAGPREWEPRLNSSADAAFEALQHRLAKDREPRHWNGD